MFGWKKILKIKRIKGIQDVKLPEFKEPQPGNPFAYISSDCGNFNFFPKLQRNPCGIGNRTLGGLLILPPCCRFRFYGTLPFRSLRVVCVRLLLGVQKSLATFVLCRRQF